MPEIKKAIIAFFVITISFLLSKKVFSQLTINEIYPAPSSGEEWVELYNNSEQIIDLSYYSLFDEKNKKIIISTSSALPFSFVIATSSGVLNNTGPETVYLKDKDEKILDIASYSASISFDANKSFIRCPDGNGQWFITNTITKSQSNYTACLILTPTQTLTPTPTSTPAITEVFSPTPTPVSISYENIYLSEAMVNPVSGEKEWLEIYNDNDFLVELKNWFIDDLENAGSTPKSFNITIDKKSYGVIELPKAIFNNDSDQVRLLDFNKHEKDSFEYSSSQTGKSYGRTSLASDEWCLQEPSKEQKNNPCLTNPSVVDVFPTSSFNYQAINSPSKTSNNSNSDFSSYQSTKNKTTKKIYKSFQPKLRIFPQEKNLINGEVLGEKTEKGNKKDDILFLPIFQSFLMNFLFLRKILKSIKVNMKSRRDPFGA